MTLGRCEISMSCLPAGWVVRGEYRDTPFIRNNPPLGPYSRTTPRGLGWSWGGKVVSYERGIPVWSGWGVAHGEIVRVRCHARERLRFVSLPSKRDRERERERERRKEREKIDCVLHATREVAWVQD